MTLQPILPIAGVSDELLRVMNDRLRSIAAQIPDTTAAASTAATTPATTPAVRPASTPGINGAASLVDANRIPKITAVATLGESSITDDGTYVYTSERLGIGGSGTPTEMLHVKNSGARCRLKIENTDANQQASLELKTATASADWTWYVPSSSTDLRLNNGSDRLVINTSGQLGIGGSPGYALDVTGDVNASGALRRGGVDTLGLPGNYAAIALTGLSAASGPNNIQHAAAILPAGRYWVQVYAVCTTAGTGSIGVTLAWKDISTIAQSVAALAGMGLVLGTRGGLGFALLTDGATNLTYSTTNTGTGQFALYIDVIRWA